MRQLFYPSFKDAFCQGAQRRLGRISKTPTFAQCQQAPSCCARAQFCGSTNRRAHTRGGVRLESIKTGAEKKKGAAKRRSSILPGRANVAAMERGQL